MKNISFVGTGVMGASLVKHLVKAGYPVTVFNRSVEKARALEKDGARVATSLKELSQWSDCVFTMVGFPQDVQSCYFGSEGILENVKERTLLVDLTTSRPSLAREIEKAAKNRRLLSLDCPVSGGDVGARNATLALMVGGDKETFDLATPLLKIFGTPSYMGAAGAGQSAKMANQITIAGSMLGMVEGMLYAKQSGIPLQTYVDCISKGGAASKSLDLYAPRIMKRDMNPGFFVKHFIKDLGIALDEAREMKLALPGLALANQLYISLQAHGEGDLGTQALILALARLSNTDYLE